jgi:ATP-dependent DNA ligase
MGLRWVLEAIERDVDKLLSSNHDIFRSRQPGSRPPPRVAVAFAKACELGLEGIVSKREGSFYRCGRSRNWQKTKNPNFVRM